MSLLDIHTDRTGYKLVAWLTGGNRYTFNPPFNPFYYVKDGTDATVLTMLSNMKPANIYKREHPCVYDLNRLYEQDRQDGAVVEYLKLVDRLVAEQGFDQSELSFDKLRILAVDGEMASEGQFPNPRKPTNNITDFSLWAPDFGHNISIQDCSNDESTLLEKTENMIKQYNPDILLDYSGTGIDYEYPDIRCHTLLGRGFNIARDTYRPSPYISRFTYKRQFIERTETTVYLEGRVCMDVYKEACADLSLTGVRKRLKVIARRWFPQMEVIEVDYNDLKKMDATQRGEYCLSDARACYMVGTVYIRQMVIMARKYQVPLAMAIRRRMSHLGNWSYGQQFKPLGIVSDGTAGERWDRDLERIGFVKKSKDAGAHHLTDFTNSVDEKVETERAEFTERSEV